MKFWKILILTFLIGFLAFTIQYNDRNFINFNDYNNCIEFCNSTKTTCIVESFCDSQSNRKTKDCYLTIRRKDNSWSKIYTKQHITIKNPMVATIAFWEIGETTCYYDPDKIRLSLIDTIIYHVPKYYFPYTEYMSYEDALSFNEFDYANYCSCEQFTIYNDFIRISKLLVIILIFVTAFGIVI